MSGKEMHPWDFLVDLETNNSRNFKESFISDIEFILGLDHEFFKGVKYALDPFITFGIKKVPESKTGGKWLYWNEFEEFLDKLSSRELTGNAAIEEMNKLMSYATIDQWNNWYRRILIKDLRCGVSVKTVNSVIPNFIPTFSCQLAHDSENHPKKMTGKKIIECKLDGVRVISILDKGKVSMYSRNGKELTNFTKILEQLQIIANKFNNMSFVLDGEVMSDSFQDLMKQVYRKEHVDTDDSVLYVFDYMLLSSFKDGKTFDGQSLRINTLNHIYDSIQSEVPNIKTLDHAIVDLSTEEGKLELKRINERAIEFGYEGIMIKDVDAPYECKRSAAWLKLKPFISVSLPIVAVEEGTGKYTGMLGNFICEGEDSGKYVKVSVGSGLTDNERKTFWDNKDKLIGDIIEIKADAFIKSDDNDYHSLRFPRFVCFRDDKGE